jgi:hypothetical protein
MEATGHKGRQVADRYRWRPGNGGVEGWLGSPLRRVAFGLARWWRGPAGGAGGNWWQRPPAHRRAWRNGMTRLAGRRHGRWWHGGRRRVAAGLWQGLASALAG